MPPKKRNTRAAQLQPQPLQSDYDTDTANITDTNASVPIAPPPKRRNSELNRLVLRRYIPEIERIVQIAHFAVVYTFSPETEGWDKTGQEGTMFLCQLSGSIYPRFSVVILNRKGLENFIVEIESEEQVQFSDEYVMLQVAPEDGVPQVYGLWIFSEEGELPTTLERMCTAMRECAALAEQGKLGSFGSEERGHGDEDKEAAHDPTYEHALEVAVTKAADVPSVATQGQVSGQQIDLLKLFGQLQAPSEPTMPTVNTLQSAQLGPPRSISTADAELIRSMRASPTPNTTLQDGPKPQQNALLDLFKNAKRA